MAASGAPCSSPSTPASTFPGYSLSARQGAHPRRRRRTTWVRGLRWWWGDVDQLLLRLRYSAAELGLPGGSPGRLRAVGEFMRVFRGDRNEVLRFDDPMPFLHESLHWFTGA